MKKYFGLLLLLLGIGLLIGILYVNSSASRVTRTFSPYTLLTSSWEKYKVRFINADGRVIDYDQNSVTTSEGQSYALLQAVWMDDKATFDKVWNWTKNDMKRPNDNLFGWRWGQLNGAQYGFLANGGDNSASDADTDMALALLLAARRWQKTDYLDAAKPIITDIWNVETATASGQRYMVAGNWAVSSDKLVINPSYFAPYAWRLFARVDPAHDWMSLIDPSYTILMQASQAPLDKTKAVGLPPDWVAISTQDGRLSATNLPDLTTNYSFDAMRVPWRIGLDYQWNKEPKAQAYLNSLTYLNSVYSSQRTLPNGFTHDGTPLNNLEDPAMYATSLGYFKITQPDVAEMIYNQKIIQLYSNDTNSFRNDLPYYEENWLWFGAAFYLGYLVPYN